MTLNSHSVVKDDPELLVLLILGLQGCSTSPVLCSAGGQIQEMMQDRQALYQLCIASAQLRYGLSIVRPLGRKE